MLKTAIFNRPNKIKRGREEKKRCQKSSQKPKFIKNGKSQQTSDYTNLFNIKYGSF